MANYGLAALIVYVGGPVMALTIAYQIGKRGLKDFLHMVFEFNERK